MDDRYAFETYRGGPPTITEILKPLPERPRVIYNREFAWVPRQCADDGRVWLQWVWRITVDDQPPFYSRAILDFGRLR